MDSVRDFEWLSHNFIFEFGSRTVIFNCSTLVLFFGYYGVIGHIVIAMDNDDEGDISLTMERELAASLNDNIDYNHNGYLDRHWQRQTFAAPPSASAAPSIPAPTSLSKFTSPSPKVPVTSSSVTGSGSGASSHRSGVSGKRQTTSTPTTSSRISTTVSVNESSRRRPRGVPTSARSTNNMSSSLDHEPVRGSSGVAAQSSVNNNNGNNNNNGPTTTISRVVRSRPVNGSRDPIEFLTTLDHLHHVIAPPANRVTLSSRRTTANTNVSNGNAANGPPIPIGSTASPQPQQSRYASSVTNQAPSNTNSNKNPVGPSSRTGPTITGVQPGAGSLGSGMGAVKSLMQQTDKAADTLNQHLQYLQRAAGII
jgi:hypothetical protein